MEKERRKAGRECKGLEERGTPGLEARPPCHDHRKKTLKKQNCLVIPNPSQPLIVEMAMLRGFMFRRREEACRQMTL